MLGGPRRFRQAGPRAACLALPETRQMGSHARKGRQRVDLLDWRGSKPGRDANTGCRNARVTSSHLVLRYLVPCLAPPLLHAVAPGNLPTHAPPTSPRFCPVARSDSSSSPWRWRLDWLSPVSRRSPTAYRAPWAVRSRCRRWRKWPRRSAIRSLAWDRRGSPDSSGRVQTIAAPARTPHLLGRPSLG